MKRFKALGIVAASFLLGGFFSEIATTYPKCFGLLAFFTVCVLGYFLCKVQGYIKPNE